MKRGEGLALQTIVLAVIALVVLVVVIGVFTGGFKNIRQDFEGLTSCEARNGQCSAEKIEGQSCFQGFGCGKDANKDKKWCCVAS